MAALRDLLEAGLKAATPQAVIFGKNAPRLPNTTLFSVPRVKAETAIIALDLNGIAVSSGSACSSGRVQASSVLTAMGVGIELTRGALRISLGWTTSDRDVESLLNAWNSVVSSLLKEHATAA
jgi:cysteine desulfurase